MHTSTLRACHTIKHINRSDATAKLESFAECLTIVTVNFIWHAVALAIPAKSASTHKQDCNLEHIKHKKKMQYMQRIN